MEDRLAQLVQKARQKGASFAEARFQDVTSTLVAVENGRLKSYESQKLRGIGIRVLVRHSWGYASCSDLASKSTTFALATALKLAKASSRHSDKTELSQTTPITDSRTSPRKIDPTEVSAEEKIRVALEANKAAMTSNLIKNSATRIGTLSDKRISVNSEGSEIKTDSCMVGLGHLSVAKLSSDMERVSAQKSLCSGFEYLRDENWNQFAQEISQLAEKAVRARTPKAGTFEAVADPELIGLILHEAFGHASEGDLVSTKESVLEGQIGTVLASPQVTILDEGIVEGGYFVPYDDEAVPKGRTIIVENGVLKSYLHSRQSALELGVKPTGNARAMDFESNPIVRQTNFYMQPGDRNFEELIEDVKEGYYIRGRGGGGGQVDVGGGTFTFAAGPSYHIHNGEVKEMVRGTTVSGAILETLKTIYAVGDDLQVTTSVFGGCGKEGQLVKVGDGGPHVRIGKITVGGSG